MVIYLQNISNKLRQPSETADAQNISVENSICLVVHKEKAEKIVQKEHCHEQDCFIFSALTF